MTASILLLTMMATALSQEGDCPFETNMQPLRAVDQDAQVLQTFDAKGRLAWSTDGGERWHINDRGCRGMLLQFWRLTGPPEHSCFSYLKETDSPPIVEAHVCTYDGGATWKPIFEANSGQKHVTDVTADTHRAGTFVAVRSFEVGRSGGARIIRTSDGGSTWHDAFDTFGSAQIVSDSGNGTFAALTGQSAAAYTQLWRLGFETDDVAHEMAGPWTGVRDAQITQAAINSFDTEQWLVSVWQPHEKREVTYLSWDAGKSFDIVKLPNDALWPIEFVDENGGLLTNLRSKNVFPGTTYAALFSPVDKHWAHIALPGGFRGVAMARGGAIFAVSDTMGLHRLTAVSEEGPIWKSIALP